MRKIISLALVLLSIAFVSCEKDTEGISKMTAFPQFQMEGKAFMNVKQQSSGSFEDPGVKAFVGTQEYPVKISGQVDVTKSGLYQLIYESVSTEGFPTQTSRKILVTPELVTENYSGTYSLVHATRKKDITVSLVTGELGYYKASDCWWQASAIPLEFLDLGGTEFLVLTKNSGYGPLNVVGTLDKATMTITFDAIFTSGSNAGAKFKTSWTKK